MNSCVPLPNKCNATSKIPLPPVLWNAFAPAAILTYKILKNILLQLLLYVNKNELIGAVPVVPIATNYSVDTTFTPLTATVGTVAEYADGYPTTGTVVPDAAVIALFGKTAVSTIYYAAAYT